MMTGQQVNKHVFRKGTRSIDGLWTHPGCSILGYPFGRFSSVYVRSHCAIAMVAVERPDTKCIFSRRRVERFCVRECFATRMWEVIWSKLKREAKTAVSKVFVLNVAIHQLRKRTRQSEGVSPSVASFLTLGWLKSVRVDSVNVGGIWSGTDIGVCVW